MRSHTIRPRARRAGGNQFGVRRFGAISASLWIALAGASCVSAQPLAVAFRGTATLPSSAVDQFGQSFTIAGLSGIAHLEGPRYLAVMDNSNKLIELDVRFRADGTIQTAGVVRALSLGPSRDYEGIALFNAPGTDPARVLLAEEGTPAVREIRLSDAQETRLFPTPPVFLNRRANFGFESLSIDPRAAGVNGVVWTANEEALSVDGPASTPSAGTTVRLLRYKMVRGVPTPDAQFAYLTQPMHGGAISGERSGLSELLVLPDGRLLALERSFAFSASFFQSRIYEVDLTRATDIAPLTSGLAGQIYTPASKRLLWSGNVNNMEGLTLSPRDGGGLGLLGIVDDGDPISTNTLVSFSITGVGGFGSNQPRSDAKSAPAERRR